MRKLPFKPGKIVTWAQLCGPFGKLVFAETEEIEHKRSRKNIGSNGSLLLTLMDNM